MHHSVIALYQKLRGERNRRRISNNTFRRFIEIEQDIDGIARVISGSLLKLATRCRSWFK
ncbi:hypothetical protein ACVXHA_12740 [Escherichia coli]